MDNNTLLKQISELIDTKLQLIKKQLDTVEAKVEAVNQRVTLSQEETIETLTAVINEGYNLHEKRIKRIEDHLQLPPTQ